MTGYKNPPKKGQFQKGKSGNPKGRPKGSKNKTIASLLEEEFNSIIKLKDGDCISKKEAAIINFSNNAIKTNKVHESAKVLEVISKLENQDKHTILAKSFLDKMLKLNYIDKQDAEDFSKGRKAPHFNFPKGALNMLAGVMNDDIVAWENVRTVSLVGDLDYHTIYLREITTYSSCCEEEVRFWNDIIKRVIVHTDLTKSEKIKLISLLEKTREFIKPRADLTTMFDKFNCYLEDCLDYKFVAIKDKMIKNPFYKKKEQEFFRNSQLEKTMKDEVCSEKEKNKIKKEMRFVYNGLINKNISGEAPEMSDYIKPEEYRAILNWIKKSDRPAKSFKEIANQISNKMLCAFFKALKKAEKENEAIMDEFTLINEAEI